MRKIAVLFLPLALAACSDPPPMKNDAIIAEIARCKNAGLYPMEVHEAFLNITRITAIQCQQPYKQQ